MDANIRICGEAGQGVQTTSDILAKTFHALGLFVYETQDYMSRIRGGVNSSDIRISTARIYSPREKADILVALNRESLEAHRDCLAPGGAVIFDGEDGAENVLNLKLAEAAQQAGGSARMANSVASGAVLSLLGYNIEPLASLLQIQFAGKGADIAAANIACARKGAELAAPRLGSIKSPATGNAAAGVITDGSRAIAIAAARAGVKLVSCYPMTPATGVFTEMAALADKYGIVVEQAEDEIAAINMVCGAAYAGVPAMTATSGGGFCLMVEGLALAGMLELPAFIILSQRPGPATGLPTRSAQEDLKFAIHAGHGEFARAVFAPGDIHQALSLTRRSLALAHRFQTPVIMLTDQFITDLQQNIELPPDDRDPVDRCILKNPPENYQRYAITDNGVSPRAIPGGPAYVIADSDEHTPDGHITEDLSVRVAMQEKRLRKAAGLFAETMAPEIYPALAPEVMVCWGSTYGPCREAVDSLRAQGRDICLAHFPQVWPLDCSKITPVLGGRSVISVEANATAQFASLLRQAGALSNYGSVLRYDGLPFTAEYILRNIPKI